jgi:hypothetical protein
MFVLYAYQQPSTTRGQSISILEYLISRRFSEGRSVQLARLDARHAGGWVTERCFHEVVWPHADGIEEVMLCRGEAGRCFNRLIRDLSRQCTFKEGVEEGEATR